MDKIGLLEATFVLIISTNKSASITGDQEPLTHLVVVITTSERSKLLQLNHVVDSKPRLAADYCIVNRQMAQHAAAAAHWQ